MTRAELIHQIRTKRSFLCIGLDPDPNKIPPYLGSGPEAVLAFNREIIEATRDLCIAYKPNTAFYEAMGAEGWQVLKETMKFIGKDHFIIADAKRGDIGNTSRQYARAFFEYLGADAITIAPYMGEDSVRPFLEYPGKWAILLALTSNPGSVDFQLKPLESGLLFEKVIQRALAWGSPENLMLVAGATQQGYLSRVRELAPDHFLLIPGIGAQGGSLEEVARMAMNSFCGLLVNVSRSILYASRKKDFNRAAREKAKYYQQLMDRLLPATDI